jgi:hypothetical protein
MLNGTFQHNENFLANASVFEIFFFCLALRAYSFSSGRSPKEKIIVCAYPVKFRLRTP